MACFQSEKEHVVTGQSDRGYTYPAAEYCRRTFKELWFINVAWLVSS